MKQPSKDDEAFMRLALREARKGLGRTSPNPLVGAVVVSGGEIVGRGYHKKAGTPHAEVHALRDADKQAKDATIYVTLEPCNHTGRTPPCTQRIVESGIKRVVVGMVDPNPLVAGSGCDFLREKGIEVAGLVLEDECQAINRPFIKHITTGLPWVIMKAGCSLDGKLAAPDGRCAWITGSESRAEVHRIRDRVDAILVGVDTALNDDPSLTTRLPHKKGQDPTRVILDTRLRLTPTAKMLTLQSKANTLVFCGPGADAGKRKTLSDAGATIYEVGLKDSRLDLNEVLKQLGTLQLNSVLVEGGSGVHTSFLQEGLVDQVSLFMAPLFLGKESIPVVGELGITDVQKGKRFKLNRVKRFGDDVLVEGFFEPRMGTGKH
jgi:diaminohydroxyphosphoribosylaminopyrimidine deaminase/5-amino-6-(5-phosphoribosylamino)uracil reductase